MAELTALIKSLDMLRSSERYSDLTIECQGINFKVHRVIICAQSKVLAAMIDGDWLEATTRKINLEDDDSNSVARMIDFLYKAQYDEDCGVGEEATTTAEGGHQSTQELGAPLLVHAKLYVLGDKYDIPALKELAFRNYKEKIATQWNNKAFPESAEIVYNNIVVEKDVLKKAIYEKAISNISVLIDVPGFEGLLRRTNDLAADMLIEMVRKQQKTAKSGNAIQCHFCKSLHVLCSCSRGCQSGSSFWLFAYDENHPGKYWHTNYLYKEVSQ